MISEKKKISNARSAKKNTRGIYLKLSLNTDADILLKLDSVDNKQGYIKELIRNDIRSSCK